MMGIRKPIQNNSLLKGLEFSPILKIPYAVEIVVPLKYEQCMQAYELICN
jgi:hypothetical protein